MQCPHDSAPGLRRSDEAAFPACDLNEIDGLAPLLAGARARGMADAFELLGLAAILIDECGEVLHAGAAATRLLGPELTIVGRRLVAGQGAGGRALKDLIARAVADKGSDALRPVVVGRNGRPALEVRAIPIPGAQNDPMQLLKVVLVLAEAHPGCPDDAEVVMEHV